MEDMMIVELRNDIPIPEIKSTYKYPWRSMEIGQSFGYARKLAVARRTAWQLSYKNGRKFVAALHNGDGCVWRAE
jgi:hypothetical protein